jgi:hypothetical protein
MVFQLIVPGEDLEAEGGPDPVFLFNGGQELLLPGAKPLISAHFCATFLKIMPKTCKKVDKSRPFGVE